jgi:hypothetical protein
LAAFGVFAIGFAARPLGAVLFGHIGGAAALISLLAIYHLPETAGKPLS